MNGETHRLTDKELYKGLKQIIKDGMASQAMATLTGGAFLTALALRLGANNAVIGLLASLPFIAQLVQIPALFVVEWYRSRRAICVWASAISRTAWLVVAFIPLLLPLGLQIEALLWAVAIHSVFAAISNASWNSWIRDLVPEEMLGRFFSRRMTFSTLVAIILSLLGGYFLDFWSQTFPGKDLFAYSILYFFGFFFGMIGVHFLSTIPDVPLPRLSDQIKLKVLLKPFADRNFRTLIHFSSFWNFAINLASPFFVVYMLKRLELSMLIIVGLQILSQLVSMMFLGIWGKLADAYSNKSVLAVSAPLYIGAILSWSFTTLPEKHFLTFPLLVAIHIAMGASQAGVNIATGNIGLKLSPRGEASPYLAAYNVFNSLMAAAGAVLGGKLADMFRGFEFSWILQFRTPEHEFIFVPISFQHLDFLFLFAFFIGVYSLGRLSKVQEVGEVHRGVVVDELLNEVKKPLREFSLESGLRSMSGVLLLLSKKERDKNR